MNANDHPYKVTAVDSATMTANDHPFKVLIEGGAVTPEQFAELEAKVDALATDLTFKGSVETYGDLPETADDGDTYLVSSTGILYTFVNNDPIPLNEGVNVVQTTGTSTTDVMSQNATSEMVFHSGGDGTRIEIGQQAYATPDGNYPIAIGVSSQVSGIFNNGIAIGHYALSDGNFGLAIGSGSSTDKQTKALQAGVALGTDARAGISSVAFSYGDATTKGQFDIGASRYPGGIGGGYNSSSYRLLTGVYDPQSAHDAATKGYVDGLVGDIESALSLINNGGN